MTEGVQVSMDRPESFIAQSFILFDWANPLPILRQTLPDTLRTDLGTRVAFLEVDGDLVFAGHFIPDLTHREAVFREDHSHTFGVGTGPIGHVDVQVDVPCVYLGELYVEAAGQILRWQSCE